MKIRRSKKVIAILLSAIMVSSIAISLAAIHESAVSGVTILGDSEIHQLQYPNLSYAKNYTAFMNSSVTQEVFIPYFVYFPFHVANSNIWLALMPSGSHVGLNNQTRLENLPFGAYFGIASLNYKNSESSKLAVAINRISVTSDNSSYYVGRYPFLLEVDNSTGDGGSFDYPGVWDVGYVLTVILAFYNLTGYKLLYLPLGTYYLYVDVSVYIVHPFYKQYVGNVVMHIPWAVIIKNYNCNTALDDYREYTIC